MILKSNPFHDDSMNRSFLYAYFETRLSRLRVSRSQDSVRISVKDFRAYEGTILYEIMSHSRVHDSLDLHRESLCFLHEEIFTVDAHYSSKNDKKIESNI